MNKDFFKISYNIKQRLEKYAKLDSAFFKMSLKEKEEYLSENFILIGKGTTRNTYALSGKKAIKLATYGSLAILLI